MNIAHGFNGSFSNPIRSIYIHLSLAPTSPATPVNSVKPTVYTIMLRSTKEKL